MKKLYYFLFFSYLILTAAFSNAQPLDDASVSVWVNEAIVNTYTFNANNYMQRQKSIAKYFTAKSWEAYSKAALAAEQPKKVMQNKYQVSAVATLPPKVKKLTADHWQAKMPVLVAYENPQGILKQNLDITITFTKTPAGQGVRGMAITSLQSKKALPSYNCKPVS